MKSTVLTFNYILSIKRKCTFNSFVEVGFVRVIEDIMTPIHEHNK